MRRTRLSVTSTTRQQRPATSRVWFKIISPNDITEGPFMVTSWGDEAPHDDVATGLLKRPVPVRLTCVTLAQLSPSLPSHRIAR